MTSALLDALKAESAAVLAEIARLLRPYYGRSGSLDLDLRWYPYAEGPSYYNQMTHYPLLLLSSGVVPGASDQERAGFRESARRNIEYVLGITDNEFRTPHYSRGTDWGAHVGEWLNFFLLRSIRLLEQTGDEAPALLDGMRRTVRGAASAIYRRFSERFPVGVETAEFPGNHPAWHALFLAEAGAYYGEAAWQGYARGFYDTYVFPTQSPAGVWPEGGGIVVNYSTVTALAVSLYADATGDARARPALEQALAFLRFFTFPDGTSSVAADCRMRYSPRPQLLLPPAFLRYREGVELCLQRVATFRRELRNDTLADNTGLSLAFFACLVHALFDSQGPKPGDISLPTQPGSPPPEVPVSRIENGTWQCYLSGQLTSESRNRFHLDAQNFLEVWHRESGYLVGGGNSKYMPRFSTLRRTNRGRAYIPDEAQPGCADAKSATWRYHFGTDLIRVAIALDGGEFRARFSVEPHQPDAAYEGCLTLPVRLGDMLTFAGGSAFRVVPDRSLFHPFADGARQFRWQEREFTVPANAYLEYPLAPHNPYRQDSLPEVSQYVARLAWPLSPESSAVLIR